MKTGRLLAMTLIAALLLFETALAIPTPKPTAVPTPSPIPMASPTPAPETPTSPAAETAWAAAPGAFPDPADYFGPCAAASGFPGAEEQSLCVYHRASGWPVALTRFLLAVEEAGNTWTAQPIGERDCYQITAGGICLTLLPDYQDGFLLIGDLPAVLGNAARPEAPTAAPASSGSGQWITETRQEKCEICGGTGQCNMCHGTGRFQIAGFAEYAVDCDPACHYCQNGYRTYSVTVWATAAP